ncbi:hypothetical protein GUJ93_ZPchr0054g2849 [Zizania palustris]|uniref:Uncharacterized protein n=1 Tax=Zizania palustris TaxID=103762 RepID=A0A8J5RD93_ZIZPA|nr:hypothetical protein GUJ93_ZPchr0054g2849 [Zizania palustris]
MNLSGEGRGLVVEVNQIGGDAEGWLTVVEMNWSGGGLPIILIHGRFDLGRAGELTIEANRIGGGGGLTLEVNRIDGGLLLMVSLWGGGLTDVEMNRIGGDAEGWLAVVEMNWSGGGLPIILVHGRFDLGRGGELTIEANRIGGGGGLTLEVNRIDGGGEGLTDVEKGVAGFELIFRYLRCVVRRSFTVIRNYSGCSSSEVGDPLVYPHLMAPFDDGVNMRAGLVIGALEVMEGSAVPPNKVFMCAPLDMQKGGYGDCNEGSACVKIQSGFNLYRTNDPRFEKDYGANLHPHLIFTCSPAIGSACDNLLQPHYCLISDICRVVIEALLGLGFIHDTIGKIMDFYLDFLVCNFKF